MYDRRCRVFGGHLQCACLSFQIRDRIKAQIGRCHDGRPKREHHADGAQVRIGTVECTGAGKGIFSLDRVAETEIDIALIDHGQIGRCASHRLNARVHNIVGHSHLGQRLPRVIPKATLLTCRNTHNLGACCAGGQGRCGQYGG